MDIKIVDTVVTTDSAGRPIDAIPVREWVAGDTDAAGRLTNEIVATETAAGTPVRVVEGKTATNSAGQLIDVMALSGVGGEPVVVPKYALLVIEGASNEKGGDPAGTFTSDDYDLTGRIRQFVFSNGTIADITTGEISIPGGTTVNLGISYMGPAMAFAKAYAATLPETTKVLIVLCAVGGRGVYEGAASTPGVGPWSPDGAGPKWAIGGDGTSVNVGGSLYLFQSDLKAAVYSACEAEVGEGNVLDPIFYGCPCNQNDTGGTYPALLDLAARAITGIRTAWGVPNAPWVASGSVPEWTVSGALPASKIDPVLFRLEETIPHYAYRDGPPGYQSPTEGIHFTNAGNRVKGAQAFPLVAIAAARSSPVPKPVDWLDGMSNVARSVGFYRGLSAYGTGAALRAINGNLAGSETDINFLSNGEVDFASLITHADAGTGDDAAITRAHDTAGSGTYFVPEGTQAAGALTIRDNAILWQGKRPTWGDDLNLIMLKDAAFNQTVGGASLWVGTFRGAGNKNFGSSIANSPSLGRVTGGNIQYRINGTQRTSSKFPDDEPSWVTALAGSPKGYQLHAILVNNDKLYIDGVEDTGTALNGNRTPVTISIASPAVVTATAHGLSVGNSFTITTTGALPTGLTATSVPYFVQSVMDANNFTLAASNGGAAINTSGSQSGVHTVTLGSATYVNAGTGWGGIIGTTNRYGASRYTQYVHWSTALTGDDLAKVLAYSKLFAAKDSIDSNAAVALLVAGGWSDGFSGGFG